MSIEPRPVMLGEWSGFVKTAQRGYNSEHARNKTVAVRNVSLDDNGAYSRRVLVIDREPRTNGIDNPDEVGTYGL